MTPEALADLHARAMVYGAAWSTAAFADTLAHPRAFLVDTSSLSALKYPRGEAEGRGADSPPPPARTQVPGFALGRVIAGEAELLTLAVDPAAQRNGLGRALLRAFEEEAASRAASTAFLEVSQDNIGAVKLYLSEGWQEVGRRENYYADGPNGASTAVIMRKALGESP